MENLNFYTLVVILVANLVVLWWMLENPLNTPNFEGAKLAHIMWTGTWLFWLGSWIVLWVGKLAALIPAVMLEDIGAILLLGVSVSYMGGMTALKKYAPIPIALFVMIDVVWPATVMISTGWKGGSDNVLINTVLFAPSLCLAVFAIGLLAWSFLHVPGNLDLSISMVLFSAGYALFQVVIYQANLFTSGLKMPELWGEFLFVWRIAFVGFYWLSILASVGVRVPLKRVLSHAGWLPPILATALLEYLRRR